MRLRKRQSGIVTAMAAILLVTFVLYILNQSYGIIGTGSEGHRAESASVAAFFAAESGLEYGYRHLDQATDPTVGSVCAGAIASYDIESGTSVVLTSAREPAGCATGCTKCILTATGTVDGASRTLIRELNVSLPSGGAYGCGGGGVTPVDCPSGITPTPPASDKYKDIDQSIKVETVPAVLISNVAYSRHPAGGANTIDAVGCVTIPPTNCTADWNDESSTSSGSVVVGSRGVSAFIPSTQTVPATFTLSQNLSADSLFAAVGARIGQASGKTLKIVGSYWNDNAGGTTRNNSSTGGTTNNGAASSCTNADPKTCPNDTPVPSSPNASQQARTSWCDGADTLLFGFSGKSATNNSGALTSFVFGSAPESVEVPNGVAAYPRPATGTPSEIYATLRYLHNPGYLSPTPETYSGALVSAYAGSSFTTRLYKNEFYLEVTSAVTGAPLISGMPITVATESFNATTTTGCKTTASLTTDCASSGGPGFYGITAKHNKDVAAAAATAKGTTLYVTAAKLAYIGVGDTVFENGVSKAATVTAMLGGASGGMGNYTLSAPLYIPSATDNVSTNGTKVTTIAANASPPEQPTVGTRIAIRYTGAGTGTLATSPFQLATAATVSSDATNTTVSFELPDRPIVPLNGAQLCGGICAFFDHSSASATTNFTVGISETNQWASGMTCLSGVDTATITGLIGAGEKVKTARWREQVN